MKLGDTGYIDPTFDPSGHSLDGTNEGSSWIAAWGDVISGGRPVILSEDFVNNWLVAYNSGLPRGDMLLVPKAKVSDGSGNSGGGGGSTTSLQELESQVPGIGGALVKAQQGWDNLNWIEKGAIIAAVVAVGWEVIGAVLSELGISITFLGVLRAIPLLGNLLGGSGGGGGGGVSGVIPAGYVKVGKLANGIQFYRRGNRMGSVSHKGFKSWPIRKPIVLFSDGTKNIKTLARATRAVKRQLRGLDQEFRSMGVEKPRKPRAPKKFTLEEFEQMKRLGAG